MPTVRWKNGTRRKAYEKLPLTPEERAEADAAIVALSTTPRPPGCKKLSGDKDGLYRIVICGSYRVLYSISAEEVLLVDVADRKDIYR